MGLENLINIFLIAIVKLFTFFIWIFKRGIKTFHTFYTKSYMYIHKNVFHGNQTLNVVKKSSEFRSYYFIGYYWVILIQLLPKSF